MEPANDDDKLHSSEFSCLDCWFKPEEASNARLYEGYANLELHLGQFLSNIAQDATFLPHAIYKPRVDVLVNHNLVFSSKILDFQDDIFDQRICIKVFSPKTTLTLRLYDCEDFCLADHKGEDADRVVNLLRTESSDLTLVSHVDLQLGLLQPERDYEMIFAFKSNPLYYGYNPGGILVHPTKNEKACVLTSKVCGSCKLCAYLAFKTIQGDSSFDGIRCYFDYSAHNNRIVHTGPDYNDEAGDAEAKVETDNKSRLLNHKQNAAEGSGPANDKEDEVEKHKEDNNEEREQEQAEDDDDDESRLKGINTNEQLLTSNACKCARLFKIPKMVKSERFQFCTTCTDYQPCCEHAVKYYYVSVVARITKSNQEITPVSEFFASMLDPYLTSNARTFKGFSNLASFCERGYQNLNCASYILKHLGITDVKCVISMAAQVFAPLLLGFLFPRALFAFVCFALGWLCVSLRSKSRHQYAIDCGDVFEVTRRLKMEHDDGCDKLLEDLIKEDPRTYPEEISAERRNNVFAVDYDIVDKTRLYTKLDFSFRRNENIALKTMAFFCSATVPRTLTTLIAKTLNVLDFSVASINSLLAVLRNYGLLLAVLFSVLGILDLSPLGHLILMLILRTFALFMIASFFKPYSRPVAYFWRLLYAACSFIATRVHRKEWFLNA